MPHPERNIVRLEDSQTQVALAHTSIRLERSAEVIVEGVASDGERSLLRASETPRQEYGMDEQSNNPFFGGSDSLAALELLERDSRQVETENSRRSSLRGATLAERNEHSKYKERFGALQAQVEIERDHYKAQLQELRAQIETMRHLMERQKNELDMRRGFSAIDDPQAQQYLPREDSEDSMYDPEDERKRPLDDSRLSLNLDHIDSW